MRASAPAFLAFFLLAPSGASADDRAEECARAAEGAQVLREHGKLRDASRELRTCLRSVCPEIVRRDCAEWQIEVETSKPTVILGARSATGEDVLDARVSVDDVLFVDRLDGVERSLDPGRHLFRFQLEGCPVVETEVVLREGEKRRPIVVTFAAPFARAPQAAKRSLPLWVFSGVGVASLAGFVALGVTGVSDLQALKDGCGKTGSCAASDVTSVRTRLWLADALLGVGVASEAIATWLWLRPLGKRDGAGFSLRVVGGLPQVAIQGRF